LEQKRCPVPFARLTAATGASDTPAESGEAKGRYRAAPCSASRPGPEGRAPGEGQSCRTPEKQFVSPRAPLRKGRADRAARPRGRSAFPPRLRCFRHTSGNARRYALGDRRIARRTIGGTICRLAGFRHVLGNGRDGVEIESGRKAAPLTVLPRRWGEGGRDPVENLRMSELAMVSFISRSVAMSERGPA
jgi:hypothetical protein